MPVSVSLDAPSGRPGLVLRYLSAVSLDKGVLHNSLYELRLPENDNHPKGGRGNRRIGFPGMLEAGKSGHSGMRKKYWTKRIQRV